MSYLHDQRETFQNTFQEAAVKEILVCGALTVGFLCCIQSCFIPRDDTGTPRDERFIYMHTRRTHTVQGQACHQPPALVAGGQH